MGKPGMFNRNQSNRPGYAARCCPGLFLDVVSAHAHASRCNEEHRVVRQSKPVSSTTTAPTPSGSWYSFTSPFGKRIFDGPTGKPNVPSANSYTEDLGRARVHTVQRNAVSRNALALRPRVFDNRVRLFAKRSSGCGRIVCDGIQAFELASPIVLRPPMRSPNAITPPATAPCGAV